MANGDDIKDIWTEIKSIRNDMLKEVKDGAEHQKNTAVMVAEIRSDIKSHIQEKTIHHGPPCYSLRSLSAKLWALAAGVLGLVIQQVITHWSKGS